MAATHVSATEKSQPSYRSLSVASNNNGLPTIQLPEAFEFDRGGWVVFTIATESGDVSVKYGGYRFNVKGSADALQCLGVVRSCWLPGQPGRGKRMQTVVFDADGPRIVFTRGSRPKIPYIRITRISKAAYEVEVPATEQQALILNKAIKERREQDERERRKREKLEQERLEEETLKAKFNTPSKFRSHMAECERIYSTLINGYLNEAADYYRFSDETKERINNGLGEIRKAIAQGVVIPEAKARHSEGNVIFIGQR